MPIFTMRLLGLKSHRTHSTEYIDPMGHALKVIYVYADTIAAEVIRFKAFRKETMNMFIDPSMYMKVLSIHLDNSISVGSSASPDDAISDIGYIFKKVIDDRTSKRTSTRLRIMPATESNRPSLHMAKPSKCFRRDRRFLSAAAFAQHRRIVL